MMTTRKPGRSSPRAYQQQPQSRWFDAHLDLATLAVEGRDLTGPLPDAAGQPQPPAVTLVSLAQGSVTHCFATIFTAPDLEGPCGYPSDDSVVAAHRAGKLQLDVYERLTRAGRMSLMERFDVPGHISTNRASAPIAGNLPNHGPLNFLILMEGADPIRNPEEAAWWFDRGVRAVGMSWARGTRYAGGNACPGPLTHAGRELVHALDEAGMIHDLSHLPDESAWEVLEVSLGPVMASHSNCRALMMDSENQRHLPDDLIRAIAERHGMIGLNLYGRFLVSDGDQRRPTIMETVAHVLHIVEVTGGRKDIVGLGSDMDGGFGADKMPKGIDSPADLHLLTEALKREAEWSEAEVRDFAFGNWARFVDHAVFGAL